MRAAAPVDGVTDAQMELTGRASLSLRDMASENGFDALAVSDWPALQDDPGMHPGAAFTWLEEVDGLPVASEGDALGAVTQIVAKALSGRVGYLLDMTEPDLDAGQLLMWHGGGGPLHLADEAGARWVNHPMIGRGTAQGPVYGAIADLVFRDGPVTVFRVARDAAALFEMTAESRRRDPSGFTGCRGWLDSFRIAGETASLEEVVATVMAHGLGAPLRPGVPGTKPPPWPSSRHGRGWSASAAGRCDRTCQSPISADERARVTRAAVRASSRHASGSPSELASRERQSERARVTRAAVRASSRHASGSSQGARAILS